MNIANNIKELIGNTPIVRLEKLSKECGANIFAKCEFMNPGGSVKDRIGYYMIESAIKDGKIDKDTTIIEPTSGNTGVALASYCASAGLKLILTMPESMSIERRKLLQIFGAKLVLTPAKDGMQGSIEKAKELNKTIKNSIILQQFQNKTNPKAHTFSTAKEILKDMDNNIDVFVNVVGTGGTLSGVGEVLKQNIKDIKIFAVEPQNSAVLSGKKASLHAIQGIGAGFIPDTLNTSVYDEVITIKDEDAIKRARDLAKDEGLLVGISSGANIDACLQIAKRFPDKNILTILCDTGERYLSTALFENML